MAYLYMQSFPKRWLDSAQTDDLETMKSLVEDVRHILSFDVDESAEALNSLINCKRNDRRTDRRRTALHYACEAGHLRVVQFLINQCNADVKWRLPHRSGGMPIHYAAANGHFEIVKFLLEKRPMLLEATDYGHRTPLHHAAFKGHFDIVQYLVSEKQANVEAKCQYGRTAIFNAICSGNLEMVQFFAEKVSVCLDERDYMCQWTILHLAASKAHSISVIEYLLKKRPQFVAVKDQWNRTPLQVAIDCKRDEAAEFLSTFIDKFLNA